MWFYGEVERKLTLIVNKTIIKYGNNATLTESFNRKYRDVGFCVFNSGSVKHSYNNRRTYLPSALALAQKLETNQARSTFAKSFNRQTPQGPRHYPYLPQHHSISFNQLRQPQVPREVDSSYSRFKQNPLEPFRTTRKRFSFQGAFLNTSCPNNDNIDFNRNATDIRTKNKTTHN